MTRITEWIKPDEVFYMLVPNIDSAERRVFGTHWHDLELPRHLFHYSPRSLRHLTESDGLATISLETKRNPAVGTSLRYMWDDLFRAVGIRRAPVAYREKPGLPWRAACKLGRLTVLKELFGVAPLAGGGESIHAIFRSGLNSSRLMKRTGMPEIPVNRPARFEEPPTVLPRLLAKLLSVWVTATYPFHSIGRVKEPNGF